MKYNHKKIEKKWHKKWEEERVYEPDFNNAKNPFYNLMMFPYPSAEGLHVGNMYAFTGSDVYGRFMRMQEKDVFEPIGLDGFGIHSENYAIKTDTHPKDQAETSEKNFYKQLQSLGNGFAWEERVETYNPEYYKWTQWIFIQMFKSGLAYRKKSPVNWCPSCMTVLADEQVEGGACERCESEVIQKDLTQWFFKITNYAEDLLGSIEGLDWSEKVKIAQKNWIGKSEGSLIQFQINNSKNNKQSIIEVFTTRPDTLFGATYLVLAPEHPSIFAYEDEIINYNDIKDYIHRAGKKNEIERIAEGKEKTGVELKGIKAVNPATGEEIPMWVADYVLGSVGTGAIMAVPAHDERDFDFAKKFGLPIRKVIEPHRITPPQVPGYGGPEINVVSECWTGDGKLIHSGEFTGTTSEEAGRKITEFVQGKWTVKYRLRDWLISRQRYWGPPIPIIYCRRCWEEGEKENKSPKEGVDYAVLDGKEHAIHAVPEKDLPVELPYVKNFRPTGTEKSPLATVDEFCKTTCPECGGEAKRETDVSDTFLDSAWYYYRYPSVNLENSDFKIKDLKLEIPWNREVTKRWLPVDMYIGGAEHSVLHLLYTRFITRAFYDWGLIDFKEPFTTFRAHGLLIKEGAKMSKSKNNIINPDEYIEKFGADVLRTYLMFLAPFEQGGDFRDESVMGIVRFFDKVWKLVNSIEIDESLRSSKKNLREDKVLEKDVHKAIKKVTEDLENLKYNTAISELMILLDSLTRQSHTVLKEDLEIFLQLLAPFAPHITEEIWRDILGNKNSIHLSRWPEYNSEIIKEDKFRLVVQINGKTRDIVDAKKGISKESAEKLAFSSEKAGKHLKEIKIEKVIFVRDRLINFVIKKQ